MPFSHFQDKLSQITRTVPQQKFTSTHMENGTVTFHQRSIFRLKSNNNNNHPQQQWIFRCGSTKSSIMFPAPPIRPVYSLQFLLGAKGKCNSSTCNSSQQWTGPIILLSFFLKIKFTSALIGGREYIFLKNNFLNKCTAHIDRYRIIMTSAHET